MELTKTYHGFTLVRKERVASIASTAHLFRHNKTGAELLFIKNKDPELLYTVAFRTPTDNDTGKPHIFEHATMMSSEKYPVRDAFIGMYRSAHTSFLNAMTFPDKTVYPVGSTNKKEFRKLVDVYTDTALRPKIHEEKNLFLQEGVRFEIDDKDNLSLNGVVFNEMKGALSSPDRQLEEQAINLLFPDNTYQYCSGGLPEAIPTLPFKELIDYHTTCYHPSNAHFYFYGDISIQTYLKYLNEEYLSTYKKTKQQKIVRQKTKKLRDASRKYTAVTSYEQHSLGFKLQKNKKEEDRIASELLMELLMGDANAPLKKVLTESGIAQDYEHMYEDEMQDLFTLFIAKNAKKNSGKQFKKIVTDTLQTLAQDGFSQNELDKVLARYELSRKASGESTGQGLHLFRLAETSWLYGDDPILRLQETDIFMENKNSYTNAFFKKLVKKLFLNNEHSNLLTLTPTKNDLQKEAIDKLLVRETKKLTNKKKEELRTQMREFTEWQNDDTLDDFKKFFPTLPLSEIPDEEVYSINPTISKKKTATYVWDKGPKHKLSHMSLWLDISHVSYKDMPYVELLSRVLVESSTRTLSSEEVVSNIGSLTTGIYFAVNGVDTKQGNPKAYLQINFAYLGKNEKQVFKLIHSLLNESQIDESKFAEIVDREIARMETSVIGGTRIGLSLTRTFAKLYAHGNYEEYSSGVQYLEALKDIKKEISTGKQRQELQKIYSNLYTTQHAYIGAISPKNNLQELIQRLSIDNEKYKSKKVIRFNPKNEIIISESMSNYNSYAIRVPHVLSSHQKAVRSLLSTVLNPNYLWKRLRDAGGAYGGALMPSTYSDLVFLSWRDPRISGTLDDFKNIRKYIKEKEFTKSDIHQAQISLFSKLDSPITHQQQLEKAMSRTMRGVSQKEVLLKRKYLKNMSVKKFKDTSLELLKGLPKGIGTTIARSGTDAKTKNMFDVITKI